MTTQRILPNHRAYGSASRSKPQRMSVASVANQMCAACARSSVCKLGRLIMTQKSDFMDSVRCYQKQTAGNQQEFFAGFVYSDDLNENFRKAWDVYAISSTASDDWRRSPTWSICGSCVSVWIATNSFSKT